MHCLCISDHFVLILFCLLCTINCATTWQNQQNECAPSEDSDQPGHLPRLIRVFAVRMKKPWILSYPVSAPQRLWSDWANAQADLSLRWAHTQFVGFVMSRLNYFQIWFVQEFLPLLFVIGSQLFYFKCLLLFFTLILYVSLHTTKPTKRHERPAKTQISLGIRPVWSESLLCT